MDHVAEFCIQYFALICLSMVMIANALTHFSVNRRISVCSIAITLCCIALSVSTYAQEEITKPQGFYYWTMSLSILGYTLRPLCLYLFILMNRNAYRGKWSFLFWIPLIINLAVYLCAFIPGTEEIIFGFAPSSDGSLSFKSGPLRFASHLIAILYLAYLIYICVFTLKSKHFMHGITVLSCAFFVIVATVVETFFNSTGKLELLNITVMISTVAYYLFLYKEASQIDALTGMFNRETYYKDVNKMAKTFTGVIQFDINGLKYLNDNFGHREGDRCIASIAGMITHNIGRTMYGYRMGGDEFLVIVNKVGEKAIAETIRSFLEALSKSGYHCSVGYAMKDKEHQSFDDIMREAERRMYRDKDNFYRDSKFDRRKA